MVVNFMDGCGAARNSERAVLGIQLFYRRLFPRQLHSNDDEQKQFNTSRNFSRESFVAKQSKTKTPQPPRRKDATAPKSMSNPNPFVPKGSLLEQQSKRRSHLKIAVSCILAVGIVGLVAMLIQGCKRDTSNDSGSSTDNNTPPPVQQDTNPPIADTNTPMATAPVSAPPVDTNVPPVAPLPTPTTEVPAVTQNEAPAGTEYIVVAGDTLGKIAKKNGVTLKALESANPDVNPKHLKVKQKLVIPAGATSSGGVTPLAPADNSAADTTSETTYTVKSGDTLHRIAKKFGTSVKAIESENNLSTTKIKVGQKLKIPAKAESAAPAATWAPVAPVPTLPATPAPPTSTAPPPAGPSGT
jgi:LysM repeat protein